MKSLSHLGYIPHLSFFNFDICEHCVYGKQSKLEKLDLVHSNECDPMPTRS